MYKNHYIKEVNNLAIELYEGVLYEKPYEELYPLTIKLVKNIKKYIDVLALEQDLIIERKNKKYETIARN